MRLALGLALLPGLGLGLLLVLVAGLDLPVSLAWPALAQGHGQVQALGFTPLFIMAAGLQLFPRFRGRPLTHPHRVLQGAALAATAVVIRLLAQPLSPQEPARLGALVLAAVLAPAGIMWATLALHGPQARASGELTILDSPDTAWTRFLAVGGTSLGGALLIHTWALLTLAGGAVMVPANLNEAMVHLELMGFATCLVLGVASRIFGRFLLLQVHSAFQHWIPRLAVAYGMGLLLVMLGWLVDASWLRFTGSALELAVVAAWLWLVGLFDPPTRVSGTPHVTEPTRRWLRLSFAFLASSLALATYLYGREALVGIRPAATDLSAARHAMAQGFLLVVMASMAARVLPIFSADVLRSPWLIESAVSLMLLGALVRVIAELSGGYVGLAGALTALGGTLGVGGFTLFAVGLWSSLGRLPRQPRAPSPSTTRASGLH